MSNIERFVRGAAELEATERGLRIHRLPAWVRRQFPDPQLLAAEEQPAGVRLALRTRATELTLRTHPTRMAFRGMPRPRGRIDVLVDGHRVLEDELTGGDLLEIDPATGATTAISGDPHVTEVSGLPRENKLVEIWLPHNESIELLDLRGNDELAPHPTERPAWVHHGSSISQGSNATSPSETWVARAARLGGVELRNLGVGGSAMVDPFMARVIRDAPANIISVKLGINVVNLDGMHRRLFVPAVHGFLDTIRDGHPTTPLVLVSPLHCAIHEKTPGPGAFDPSSPNAARFIATGDPSDVARGRLSLESVREAMRDVLASRTDDPNLHYLDGLDLFAAGDERRIPMPDGLHPTPEAHRLVGDRFAARAFGPDGFFSRIGTRG